MALWKDLNIGIEMSTNDPTVKNFFIHPGNETLKIFVFADVPYLIKLMRNNLIDSGFVVDNKLLGKAIFEELLIIFPHKIIHCLVRTRTYIRLRNINFKIKEENILRGRKHIKKYSI